jgi:copper(I)-binding protein
LAFVFLLASSAAFADVRIENPWTRVTPPGVKIAAGYMTIRNNSATPDRLVGASSPAAEKVETHVTVVEGGISKMRQVKGYDIPANGSFELKPGGSHLMIFIKAPLKEGERVPLNLRFQHAGEVKVELPVAAMGAREPGAHESMHDHMHDSMKH